MAYDYYCMECGKLLNQETVLFDMQYLLTRDKEKKFQLLKFRMTKTELLTLINKGVPAEAGYRACSLSFAEIMAIIANENNLNAGKSYTQRDLEGVDHVIASDADIEKLTLAEIDAYIKSANEAFSVSKAKSEFDPFDDVDNVDVEEDDTPAEEYKPSPAILALEYKDETNTDKAYTKVILRADLELLHGLFVQDDTVTFKIKEENDTDNEGKSVLVGYNVAFTIGSGHLAIEARVCNHCGAKVFSHAGTAKHQAVAFIGYQKAGKTSTILALAHYAENHMIFDLSGFGDESTEIWKGGDTIQSVASVEVLDKNERLKTDLELYSQGLAPGKTEANKRADAYCATLRLKNKAQNRYYLFTLTDLPGELCNEDGTVKKERIYDHFPVALSCDAFVACFDTSSINPKGTGVSSWVMNVCRWTDEFQKMRASQNQVATYVPTMLLFTKCRDLEDPNVEPLPSKVLLPIDQTYFLKDEKRHIAKNGLYSFICDQFNEFGQLHKAYHAMMRCSPYGYKAPSLDDLKGLHKDEFHQKKPIPKNIDKLMRWLLSVSGCVPTEAEFRTSPLSPDAYRLNNYCISRPQLRSQNPIQDYELQESLARCALFENPGKFDKEYVGKYDSRAQTVVVKVMAKMQPDGNAN